MLKIVYSFFSFCNWFLGSFKLPQENSLVTRLYIFPGLAGIGVAACTLQTMLEICFLVDVNFVCMIVHENTYHHPNATTGASFFS